MPVEVRSSDQLAAAYDEGTGDGGQRQEVAESLQAKHEGGGLVGRGGTAWENQGVTSRTRGVAR